MKSRHKTVILALVAAFALTAIAASAASAALPEFKPVPTKKKFTSTTAYVEFRWPTTTVVCSKSTTAGEITSASTLGKVVIKFTGCKIEVPGCEDALTSVGAKEGEIVTDALKGELGTVNTKEAASGVGLLLEPETKTTIATLKEDAKKCIGEGSWHGQVAGEVTPTGKKQLTSNVVFAATGTREHIVEITVKRGLVKPLLEGGIGADIFGMAASNEVTFEEALEVT